MHLPQFVLNLLQQLNFDNHFYRLKNIAYTFSPHSKKSRLLAEASRVSYPSGGLLKWVPAGDRILTFEKEIETKKSVGKRKLSLGGDRAMEENETESNGTKRLRLKNILD